MVEIGLKSVESVINIGIKSKEVLSPIWKKFRSKKRTALNEIREITFIDPKIFEKCYIEPDCQNEIPPDKLKDEKVGSKKPVMEVLNNFVQKTDFQGQGEWLIVQSDAGMGKSALLAMLRYWHYKKKWKPRRYCVLKKLGDKTLDDIS
jgi:hypothetical protein